MTDQPTVPVAVPQQDGQISIFDGATTRVYDVVKGVVKVAVEDVEHFLRHVDGASTGNTPAEPTSPNSGLTTNTGPNPGQEA